MVLGSNWPAAFQFADERWLFICGAELTYCVRLRREKLWPSAVDQALATAPPVPRLLVQANAMPRPGHDGPRRSPAAAPGRHQSSSISKLISRRVEENSVLDHMNKAAHPWRMYPRPLNSKGSRWRSRRKSV